MEACVREGVNPMWYPDFLNGQGTSQGVSDLRITFAETLNIFEEREINLFAEVFVHLCVLGECMYVRVCIVCVYMYVWIHFFAGSGYEEKGYMWPY